MKLAFKLVSAFVLVVLLVTAADAYYLIETETSRVSAELVEEVRTIGIALRDSFVAAYRIGGLSKGMESVSFANAGNGRMDIRWVWHDGEASAENAPRMTVSLAQLTNAKDGVHFPSHTESPAKSVLAYVHLPSAEKRPGGIEIHARLSGLDSLNAAMRAQAWRMSAMLVALAALMSVLLGIRLVARPLRRLVDQTRRISRGDIDEPLQLRGHDELTELAGALNDMCAELVARDERLRQETAGRVNAVDQLRHADRLRTVGRLAAGVAHELGTPLNVISGRADLIGCDAADGSKVSENARIIREQAARITVIIRQLMDFARRRTPDKARTDIRTVVDRVIELMDTLARKHNAGISLQRPESAMWVDVDAGQIEQVFTNLIMNAIQATSDGGQIQITIERGGATTDRTTSGEGPFVRIDARDNGTGIEPENLDQLFEPFFTTKDVGEGTGMGLSIAYGIVQEHGGRIEVESDPGHGSCFSVYLPTEARS